MTLRWCSLLAVFFLATGLTRSDDTKKDQEALQGTWVIAEAIEDGKPVPFEKLQGAKLVITGETMTAQMKGEKKESMSIKLDATKAPKAIDFTPLDGPNKGKVQPGLYQLASGTLKLCVRDDGQARPAKLESLEGSNVVLLTFKREKP